MSEYPFLHNLIVDAYQRGRDNNVSVFDLQDFIKNNEDGFEDWIHCERIEPLERQLAEAREVIKETVDHLKWRDEIQDGLGTLQPFYEKLKEQLKEKGDDKI